MRMNNSCIYHVLFGDLRGLTTKIASNPHSALDHVDHHYRGHFHVLSCDHHFARDQPRRRYATLSWVLIGKQECPQVYFCHTTFIQGMVRYTLSASGSSLNRRFHTTLYHSISSVNHECMHGMLLWKSGSPSYWVQHPQTQVAVTRFAGKVSSFFKWFSFQRTLDLGIISKIPWSQKKCKYFHYGRWSLISKLSFHFIG
jgi:hypothetical protein